jgi:hypothetical protein
VSPHTQRAKSVNAVAVAAAALALLSVSTVARSEDTEVSRRFEPAASWPAGNLHRFDLSNRQISRVSALSQATLRLDVARPVQSGAGPIRQHDLLGSDTNFDSRNKPHFPIRWQVSPDVVRVARQFRRRGLPILRLWRSNYSVLAIGLNPRGVPGIYVTRTAEPEGL